MRSTDARYTPTRERAATFDARAFASTIGDVVVDGGGRRARDGGRDTTVRETHPSSGGFF